MQQTEPVTMPFGKHKGRLVTAVNTPYLSWLLRECHNASPALRAAVQTELARRAAARRPPATLTPTPSANDATASRPTVPPAPTGSANASSANLNGTVDHTAVLRLLSDLLDAGLRVVARGEGAVHLYGGALTPDLRDRLAQDRKSTRLNSSHSS